MGRKLKGKKGRKVKNFKIAETKYAAQKRNVPRGSGPATTV